MINEYEFQQQRLAAYQEAMIEQQARSAATIAELRSSLLIANEMIAEAYRAVIAGRADGGYIAQCGQWLTGHTAGDAPGMAQFRKLQAQQIALVREMLNYAKCEEQDACAKLHHELESKRK